MNPWEVALKHERNFQIFENIAISAVVMFVLLGAQGYNSNDAVNSRLATVYSLANYGTWRIDRPADEKPIPFEQETIDKVMIGDRLLSSKPPMLPLLMTAEYLFLHKAFGWTLDNDDDIDKTVRFMNITLVGFAYVAAIVFFSRSVHFFVEDTLARILLLFSCAFCTQLWGYSTHMNNHVPAAGALMGSLYFVLAIGARKAPPAWWRFFLFGLLGGLTATLDVPATIFVLLAGLSVLPKFPAKTIVWAGLGAAIPLAVHCGAMMMATGALLPVQMNKAAYLYEASYWRSPQGIDALNQPKGVYLFHMLFGRVGLFSLYPVLFIGMAATLRAIVNKKMPWRRFVLTGALGFIILTAYYAYKTNNYGGEAYGFRWYIVAAPVLLLMGARILTHMRVRWKWIFMGIMVGISFYSAFECARSPWGSNQEWTARLFLGHSYGHHVEQERK